MTVEEILKQLVSFNVLGGESNLSIINWIKSYIENHNVKCQLVPNNENTKASLFCRIGPAVDGGFILSGHTDVVPVEGQDWTSSPFELTDKNDGKLYARGSCDMKGFIACVLSSLPHFIQCDLKKPIYFAFSYDEEIGCLAAPELIESLLNYYEEKPQYAIVGEPSLLKTTIGQKGICVLKTHVNGSAGHSSRIKQEVSAIHEASRLIIWLENKMNNLVNEGQIDDRFNPPHTSIHIGKFNGGIAPNVIADSASFDWDVRVIPQDNLDEILDEFNNHCRKREEELKSVFPGFKITTTESHPPVPPLDTSKESTLAHLINEINNTSGFDAVSYAAEAGQFHEAGIETIICGPGSIAQAHRADEFISKEQLHGGVLMLKNLATNLSL